MARTRRVASHLLAFVAIAAVLSAIGSTVEDTKEKANVAAEDAGIKPEENVEESWTEWAREKMSQGLGKKHENEKTATQQVMETAGVMAGKAKDTVTGAATGAAGFASHKADLARESIKEQRESIKEQSSEAAGKAKSGTDQAADAAWKTYEDAREKLEDARESAKQTASEGARQKLESARQKLEEAYEAVKGTMTGKAKENYEASREKTAQAASELEAKLKAAKEKASQMGVKTESTVSEEEL